MGFVSMKMLYNRVSIMPNTELYLTINNCFHTVICFQVTNYNNI